MPARDPDAAPAEPAALLAALRAAAQTSVAAERALERDWQAALDAGALTGAALADVGLLLLQTLGDGDDSLDMTAAELLRRHGEARHLAPLRQLLPNLRPRAALRDWRLELARAIATIEARAEGCCGCGVDASHGVPIGAAAVAVEAEQVDAAAYTATSRVRCQRCGRRWAVTERFGGHYSSYAWAALDPPA